MTSFADFVEDVVALQVAYYDRVGGEYNQDPFSVRYKTRMTTERVFGLCEGADRPEAWKSLHTSRELDALATQFQDSLASEEDRQRTLFRNHCNALAQKEHELAEIQYAEDSDDPLSSILSNDPLIKKALLEYRRYGLRDLRYVSHAHVLAVVDPISKEWFFPRELPTHAVQLHPSLFCSGDATGSIEQDEGVVRRFQVPNALQIPKERQPFWFGQLTTFHPLDLLQSTPWMCPNREESMRTPFDPGQELVRAMVVTRQVSAFLGREEGFPVGSYAHVHGLHAAFYRLVKTQFVDPALEAARQRFQGGDWSNFYVTALQHLPVIRPCTRDDHGDDDDTVECIITGQTRDLVRVTVVRCPLLEWDCNAKSFEDHIGCFKARYTRGQQRWWHVATHRLSVRDRPRHRMRRSRSSSRSSTSSVSGLPETNSRHRGRKTIVQVSDASDEVDDDDFDGFVVGAWTNSLILHRTVADLLAQAWRLTHLKWWIDATFLHWKRDKSSFHSTDEETISLLTDAIVAALRRCQTPTGSW